MCFVYNEPEDKAMERRFPRSSALRIPSPDYFDYDYDYYSCQGCDDDICRCAAYEGLRLTSFPDPSETLATLLEWKVEDVSEEFFDFGVNAMDLLSADTYDISGEPGYYGEEVCVSWASEREIEEYVTWWLLRH